MIIKAILLATVITCSIVTTECGTTNDKATALCNLHNVACCWGSHDYEKDFQGVKKNEMKVVPCHNPTLEEHAPGYVKHNQGPICAKNAAWCFDGKTDACATKKEWLCKDDVQDYIMGSRSSSNHSCHELGKRTPFRVTKCCCTDFKCNGAAEAGPKTMALFLPLLVRLIALVFF